MVELFQNEQWVVTNSGLETVKPAPEYVIEASRLTETTDFGKGPRYSWPAHMAEKTWIIFDAFLAAYREALKIHSGKYTPPLDEGLLEASIDEGWDRLRRR